MRNPSLCHSKILIIDDEALMVEMLQRVLEADGYREIASTTDPFAATGLFRTFQPDLVVLDLMMPGLSGLEVLAQLRAIIAADTHLPILFVTADPTIEVRRDALNRGATDFVVKPYDTLEILARIGNLLETRHLHLQLAAKQRESSDANATLAAHYAALEGAQEALRESEERLRFTLDATAVGAWELDLATGVSRRSIRHDQIFGYDQLQPEWSYDTFLEKHVHPDDRSAVDAAFQAGMQPGGVWEFECRIFRADGREGFIWVKGITRGGPAQTLQIAGLIMDITRRKLGERELKHRVAQGAAVAALGQRALVRNHLAGLFEEAVVVVARTLGVGFGKILELEPGGQSLLLRAGVGWNEGVVGQTRVGTGPDTLSGYTLVVRQPVIVEDLRTETRFRGAAWLHEHAIVSGISVVIGREGWTFGVLSALSTEPRIFTGDHVHFLQAVANLLAAAVERTQMDESLHEAKESAERANAAKCEFLSRMSHELRTPLNLILGFGQLLEREGQEAEEADNVKQILKAGRHLLHLVDELLAISRQGNGLG